MGYMSVSSGLIISEGGRCWSKELGQNSSPHKFQSPPWGRSVDFGAVILGQRPHPDTLHPLKTAPWRVSLPGIFPRPWFVVCESKLPRVCNQKLLITKAAGMLEMPKGLNPSIFSDLVDINEIHKASFLWRWKLWSKPWVPSWKSHYQLLLDTEAGDKSRRPLSHQRAPGVPCVCSAVTSHLWNQKYHRSWATASSLPKSPSPWQRELLNNSHCPTAA